MRFVLGALALSLASPVLCAAPPIIIISVDTLRADHLGTYGYRGVATPNIDSFASGGTLYSNIACQTPLTLPSHTSLFTSTYPFENGIQENAEQVPKGLVTLASVLGSHGYKTAAFISSVFLEQEMGLDQGFGTYDSPFNFAAFSPVSGEMFRGSKGNSRTVRDHRDGALTSYAALRWMNGHKGETVFVFIHLFDLHTPYSISETAAKEKGLSRYDAQLGYEDDIIGRLKIALIHSGWWDKSLTILLSDHGEGLGDHGELSHGYFIYQSTLHVPLIFHWPAGFTSQPARIDQPAGLIDVAPTIIDFLHISAPQSFEGLSLLDGSSRVVYSESLHTHDSFGWSPLRSIRRGDYKYIEAPEQELYDLKNDPAERKNLVAIDHERVLTLSSELAKVRVSHLRRGPAPVTSVNAETEKLLASLGYLSTGPRGKLSTSGPDPKDRLLEFRLYEKAIGLVADRRLQSAIVLLKQVLAHDSKNILARRDLASCYLDLHEDAEARDNFQQVVGAAPNDYPAQFGLGIAAKHLGLVDEARVHLAEACRLAPNATQCRSELDSLPTPK